MSRRSSKNTAGDKKKPRNSSLAMSSQLQHPIAGFLQKSAFRKNKAFQQLQRELELRSRLKRKEEMEKKAQLEKEKEEKEEAKVAEVEEGGQDKKDGEDGEQAKPKENTETEDEVKRMLRLGDIQYVDRDRAAAVVFGTKDIKKVLIGQKRRERLSNSKQHQGFAEFEYETHLLQGEHELRAGDPNRALKYLNLSCELLPEDMPAEPFLLRSKCFAKLGKYSDADQDANMYLKLESGNLKGLINKAEAQYNLGMFEHSLKFFYRANHIRPESQSVYQGIRKCTEAIANSLSSSRGFDFSKLQTIIHKLEDRNAKKEEELRTLKMKKLGYFDNLDLLQNSEAKNGHKTMAQGEEGNQKSDQIDEDFKLLELITSIPPELEGIWHPTIAPRQNPTRVLTRNISMTQSQKLKEAEELQEKKLKIKIMKKKAQKQLLGQLYTDHKYLQGLVRNPSLFGKSGLQGDANENVEDDAKALEKLMKFRGKSGPKKKPVKDYTKTVKNYASLATNKKLEAAVKSCASEALTYLKVRQDFWQQQMPVYARTNGKLILEEMAD